MALTVGELVAYAKIDRSDVKRGTREIAAEMRSMQASTSSSMDSMEKSVKRSLADIEDDVGGTGAAIRRSLEEATRSLPKIKIDADSTDADTKIAQVRESLEGLSNQRVGIDVSSAEALAEVQRVKRQLEELDRMTVDPVIKADVRSAMTELSRVESTLGGVGETAERSLGVIGTAGPANVAILITAIQALPTVTGLAASGIVAALGGGMLAIGLVSAAQADRVQHAWTKTVDHIKDGMAKAAQPLEGSAIRAAAVAEHSFDRLKPTLKRVFADLVPDFDLFVRKVGDGVVSLGPVLKRIGDGFGNLLSGLGTRMPAIMANINATLNTFADIMDENPTLLADAIEDATALLSVGAKVLSWADEIKTVFSLPFGPAGAQAGSDYFYKQVFGATPQEIMQGMAELPASWEGLQKAALAGGKAMQGAGGAGDEAARGVRNLSDALKELFDPAAAALDAEIQLKQALQDAAKAAKEHKLSEVDRLSTVRDVTQAIADSATTEQDRTGKTTKASAAFAAQLPTLVDLAGKNHTARDAVAALGNSLGVTIAKTADGKIAVDRFGKAVITLPNGKKVKIDADTAKALSSLGDTKKKVDDLKGKTVKVDADTKGAQTEVGKITSKMKGLAGDAHTAGANVGSGLIAGIQSMIGQAVNAGRSLAQAALNAAKNALGIHSPSAEMAEVGKWTVKGLVLGLTSEEGNVKSTVERMVDQVKKAFAKLPDVKDHLLDFIKMGNKNLEDLALQREALVKRLAEAKEYAKTVAGNAQEWASIMGMSKEEIEAGDISGTLKSRAQAIKDFANDISALAKRGLNKTTLRQIIDAGVEKGSTIADMLVGAPGSEIKAINTAQKQIDNMSKKLGKTGADALYDVGKKAGDGYLKGLQASLKALDKEMTKIVKALVAAIKRELKIKSPSQIMIDIGQQTMQGWIVGMNNMADPTQAAVTSIVGQAVATARKIAGQPLPGTGTGRGKSLNYSGATVMDPTSGTQFGTWTPPPAAPASGVTVNMHDTVIREDADVTKVGNVVGFELARRG